MINALFSSSSSSFRWPVLSPARNAQLLSELSTPERIRLRFQLLHFNLSQVRSRINATRHISNNCACTFAGVSRLSCTHPAKLSTRLEWKRIRGWPRDLNYFSHWYSVHQFSKIWTKIFPAKEFRKNEKRLPFPRWYEVTLWKSRAKDDTFYRYREEFVTVRGEVEKRKKGRQMDGGYRVPCTVLPSLRHDASLIRCWWNWRTSRLPSYHGLLPRCAGTRICLPTLFTRLGNRVNHPANRICPYSGPLGSIRAETRNE